MKQKEIVNISILIILFLGIYTNYCVEYTNKLTKLYIENGRLTEKLENVDKLTIEIRNNERKLAFLKEEKKFQQLFSPKKSIVATVIQRDVLSWKNKLWIDKGEREGLKEGMMVLSQSGIIGQISIVSKEKSEVDLITSSEKYTRNAFSVCIQNNSRGVLGLLNTYNEDSNEIDVSEVLDSGEIQSGDSVITSGIGGVAPAGLPVGAVKRIETNNASLSKKITVQPYVNFDDIVFVTVIKEY